MSVKCEICGKDFKNTQGRRGHMTFAHQLTSSSSKSATPLSTEQELSKLKERLDKLESGIGLREPSELARLLGVTDPPLTDQISELSAQVSELSEQIEQLTDQPAEQSE